MAEEKTYMPQSSAGLTRYFDDESRGGIRITPEQVVIIGVSVMVIEILLRIGVI